MFALSMVIRLADHDGIDLIEAHLQTRQTEDAHLRQVELEEVVGVEQND